MDQWLRRMFYFLGLFVAPLYGEAETHPDALSRWEIAPGATFYTGDALRSSLLGSLGVIYHFNRDFWLGADFYGGGLSVDNTSGIENIAKDDSLFIGSLAFYWNLPVLLGATSRNAVQGSIYADFYTSVGMGYLWAGSQREPNGFIGGGLTIHSGWKRLAVRFDLKNFFFLLKNLNGDDFNSDMALNIGPAWSF